MKFPFQWLSKDDALHLLGQMSHASAHYLAYVGVRDGQIRVRLDGRELRHDQTYAILMKGDLGEGGNALALPSDFELHRDDLEALAARVSRTRVSATKTNTATSNGSIKAFAIEMEPVARKTLGIDPGSAHMQVAQCIAQRYQETHGRKVSPDTVARYLREHRSVEKGARRSRRTGGSDTTG
jgi:hypothetical protein